jgi:lantibiotic modifying enzyme
MASAGSKIARRNFLKIGVAGAIVPADFAQATGRPFAEPSDAFEDTPNYLAAAKEAARWIRSAESRADGGGYWLPDPDHPEKAATVSLPSGFYSGSAGIVLFFLQLAEATGDESYIEDAKRGGDYLLRSWRESVASNPAQLGYYSGLAGTMFGLVELWKATRMSSYRDAALQAANALVSAARPIDSGIEWGGPCGMSGDAGILLCLLHVLDAWGGQAVRDAAIGAGTRLVERAEQDSRGGLRWQGFPPALMGAPEGTYWPNFQLGTSGVAFALGRLAHRTDDPRFLAAARAGALNLERIAAVKRDAALVPYREPDSSSIYYLGYCGGPAGTARLFYELYRITKEDHYLAWTERLAHGIMESGIPERQTPGFWNVACQCCGSAGISDFFLGLWAATKRPEYLAFARRVGSQLLSRAVDLDGKGCRWYQAYTRVKPWEVTAETGYMIGAAGIGASFVHLHLAEQGRYRMPAFPDNPFPVSSA